MSDNSTLRRQLELTALVFSVLVGSVNLGVVVWKGGALVADHERLKERVASIESSGSRSVSEHIKVDELREQMVGERIAKVEAIISLLPDLTSKLAIINVKLDDLKQGLEEHKRQTTGRSP